MRPFKAIALIFILTVMSATLLHADTPWWNRSYGETQNDYGAAIATDASGNIFVAGSFAGSIDLGGGELIGAGDWDMFVAKFDANGYHLWSHAYGGTSADNPVAVAIDPSGDVFVLGTFMRTVDFGGGPMTTSDGVRPDVFVVKYGGATGAYIWGKRFGGDDFDTAGGIYVDDMGRSVIVGGFTGTTDFGGGSVTSSGIYDIFIVEYDSAGNHIWSMQLGNSTSQCALDVALDASYNVIVTGEFWGAVDFGGGMLTSSGNKDVFVAKYSAGGAHVWSKRYGINDVSLNNDPQSGRAIAVNSANEIIVAGDFVGAINFGGGTLHAVGNAEDVFLAQLDENGAHLWSRSFGGPSEDHANGVAVDGSDRVSVVGSFRETANFGGGAVASNDFSEDLFIAKYDDTGAHLWSGGFGDANNADQCLAVAFDPVGDLLVTGRFRDTLDFGRWPVLSTDGTGDTDVFAAKFTSDPTGIRPLSEALSLFPPHPNPFNPVTHVEYVVDHPAPVHLAVYDTRGREVAVLVDGIRPPGRYTAQWRTGGEASEASVASGVYFIRLEIDGRRATQKAVLLK